jgi:hypothetical protein
MPSEIGEYTIRGTIVDKENGPFVHLLVFQCSSCREPILITLMREEHNLEKVDGQAFDLLCKCGCLKRTLGLEAVGHHIAPWELRPSFDGPPRTPQIPSDI